MLAESFVIFIVLNLSRECNMSYEKESYISKHEEPCIWRQHANYKILCEFRRYIHGHVADFGSNHCALSILLNDFNPEKIYCFDINGEALNIGAATCGHMQLADKMAFIIANLKNVALPEQSFADQFDLLVSFHTLEHIYEHDAPHVTAEMFRVVKPGGYVIISIPYETAYPDPTHVAFYNEKTLSHLMETAGFVTLECFKDDRFNEKDLLTGLFYKPRFVKATA